jgi:hypothetical protein
VLLLPQRRAGELSGSHERASPAHDGECFDDIDVGGGSSIHVEPSAPYLGSLLTSDGKDDEDVALRIRRANGMFGSLQACLFKQKGFSNEAKVAVYNSLVLSVRRE